MKNRYSLVLVGLVAILVLSACGPALAASAQTSTDKPNIRTLTATGSGKVYLTPDLAYLFIGVRSQAENVADALTKNNNQTAAVSSVLKELGVDVKDIQTSAFNVYPQPEYGDKGVIVRQLYVVENTVNVTIRDLSKLGQALDTVVRSGANNINGIQFDVKEKAKAITEARRLAIEDARRQAQEIASAAGVELGSLQSVNAYSGGGPVPMYEGKGGGAASFASSVPISSGQLVITIEASLVYEMK